MHGDVAQDLAVQIDIFSFEGSDQLGVGRSGFARCGVDPGVHEAAVVPLLLLPTDVRVGARFNGGRLGQLDLGLASPHHALGTGQDVLSAFDV